MKNQIFITENPCILTSLQYSRRSRRRVMENFDGCYGGKAKESGIKELSLRAKCYMEAYMIYNHLGFKDSQCDQRHMTKSIGEKVIS